VYPNQIKRKEEVLDAPEIESHPEEYTGDKASDKMQHGEGEKGVQLGTVCLVRLIAKRISNKGGRITQARER